MQADVRRKLTMAARALQFTRANPPSDASHVSVVSRLEERLAQADLLALQEKQGRRAASAAVARRKELRRRLHQKELRHLVRTADVAAKENPQVGPFRLPAGHGPYRTFLTDAIALLEGATPFRDVLVQYGLGETLLDDIRAALDEFDTLAVALFDGREAHIRARAGLFEVAEDCVDLVGLLDGIHRARFEEGSEALAGWTAARNIVGPFTRRREPFAAPVEGEDPDPPVDITPRPPAADEEVA